MTPSAKIFLGIDPGFGRTGFGVIRVTGSKIECVDYGVIETSAGCEFATRLLFLATELKSLICKYKPVVVAVEELFFYKNITTAIKVAEARGVIILKAVEAGCEVMEFTPLQVKQAISCYGRAEKAQIQKMVKTFLNLKEIPKPDDAADALAIAICASGSHRMLSLGKK